MNHKTIVAIIAAIYVVSTAIIIAVNYNSSQEQSQTQEIIKNIKISPEALRPAKTLQEFINELPDGSLKSNLMIVIGTEYSGDSQQLNEILQAYAKLKIKEIERNNKL
jgi:hypothetical protein